MRFAQDLKKFFRRSLARISQPIIFKPTIQRVTAVLSSRLLMPFLTMWAAAFGGNPLGGRVVLGVVVANCSGDHFREMRSWHSAEALNRLLAAASADLGQVLR